MTDFEDQRKQDELQTPAAVAIAELKRNRAHKVIRSGDWTPPSLDEMETLLVLVRVAYRTIKVDDLSDVALVDKDGLTEIMDSLRHARDQFDTLALICASGFENLRAASA
jgi:hypothetical protein